jgi:signal transduction histidine kinase
MLSEVSLDIRTLAYIATLLAVMQAVLLTILWRAVPRAAGTPIWAAGGVLLALGFVLLALRDLLPDMLSIVVANVAIAGAHALYLLGIDRYCGRSPSYRVAVAVLAVTLVLFVVYGLVIPDTAVRIVVISLALLAFSVISAWRLWRREQGVRSPIDLLMAAMFVGHSAFHLFRGGYTFLVERGIEDFMAASTIHVFAFIDVIVFCFASGIGFAVLTISALHRSLEKELVDKNRLFSVLAHDLRSPFGGLVNLTDLIQIAFSKNQQDQVAHLAKQLSAHAKQVLALLDDLLVWGRAEFKGEKALPEPLDLEALVGAAISPQSMIAAEKGISIRTDLEVTTAFGVRTHAEMVLRNLLSNALKFSRPETEVTVRSSCHDGRVVISVSDQGIGLSGAAETSAEGVNHFANRPGTGGERGTGLGLTLCVDLCRGDHQEIWLAENPGGGAVASFSLSVWNPGDRHSASPREAGPASLPAVDPLRKTA